MKSLISLAIAGLIQAAVAPEGRQLSNGSNLETLAERLALIIPNNRVEMLLTGVPINVKVVDSERLLDALSKRVRHPLDSLRVRSVTVDEDFRGRIAYSYSETKYAATEEDAANYNDTEDWYNCSSEPRADRQFPFKAWCNNSCNIELNEDQLAKYGLEIELL